METPRVIPIHRALTCPVLLAGADRRLVILNWTTIAALVLGVGFHWASCTVAFLLATVGHWALLKATKYDPYFRRIYVRQLSYQAFYPAQASVHAPPQRVFPAVLSTDRR